MGYQDTNAKALQREVFHRVSNNFQLIQSMIRLVARDPSVADPAREMEERIQLLSIAHNAQHCLETNTLSPFEQALPGLISGMRGAGLLRDKVVRFDIGQSVHSLRRSHAMMHLVLETLRALDQTDATGIDIIVTADGVSVTSDATQLTVSETTQRLVRAYAHDLGGPVIWAGDGLTARFRVAD